MVITILYGGDSPDFALCSVEDTISSVVGIWKYCLKGGYEPYRQEYISLLFCFCGNSDFSTRIDFPAFSYTACDSKRTQSFLGLDAMRAMAFIFFVFFKTKKALSIQKSYLELERSSIRDFGKL